MLEVARRGFFRNHHDVALDGHPLTTMQDIGGEECAFTLDGQSFTISRPRRKHFVLNGPDGTHASATMQKIRHWTISSPAGEFEIVKPKFFSEMWELRQAGQAVGTVRKRGLFNRSLDADLSESLPLLIRLFSAYLVTVILRRSGGAAAAAGS